MEKTTTLNEIMIRFDEAGKPTAAHIRRLERITDAGETLAERYLDAEPLNVAEVATVLGEANAQVIIDNEALREQVATVEAKDAEIASLKARIDELTAPPVVSENPLENPLTASQFEAALILMGIDGDEIEPAIVATITDPIEQAKAIGGWRRLVSITRDNAIMSMLKPYFSVTDEQIDEAWTQAAGF